MKPIIRTKLPVINVFSVDEIESHISPDAVFNVRQYKGEIYIVSQYIALKYEGNETELVSWLEENLFDNY